MAHLLKASTERPELPVTRLYALVELDKRKGGLVKKKLVDEGLALQEKSSYEGNWCYNLRPTKSGDRFLGASSELLKKPLIIWETKRFGGAESRKLASQAAEWARDKLGAVEILEETDDSFGGKWDILAIDASGKKTVIEIITGESKLHEIIHMKKRRNPVPDP